MRRKICALLVADALVAAVLVAISWWQGSYEALTSAFFPMLLNQLLMALFLLHDEERT